MMTTVNIEKVSEANIPKRIECLCDGKGVVLEYDTLTAAEKAKYDAFVQWILAVKGSGIVTLTDTPGDRVCNISFYISGTPEDTVFSQGTYNAFLPQDKATHDDFVDMFESKLS